MSTQDSRSGWSRCSFPVRLFHPLQHAGLSRRTAVPSRPPSRPQANADFLYYVLGRTDFSVYGKQAVKGYTLNQESLKSVEIRLPVTREEQTAIATILSDMDAEIAALETKLEKARQIKQGMMHNLLTGAIRLV